MAKKRTLDDLVRRYESGDRDPDLLDQLNKLAWTGFHDPWEPASQPLKITLSKTLPAETFDMETVQPFTLETVVRFLECKGWRIWKHPGDIVMVHFRYDPDSDRESTLQLSVEGQNHNIFRMRWTCDRRVNAERFDQAFRLCNKWNDFARWPRAHVEMPPRKESEEETEMTSGLLTLDFQLFLAKGIHQALFNDLLHDVISSGWDFWTMAHTNHGL